MPELPAVFSGEERLATARCFQRLLSPALPLPLSLFLSRTPSPSLSLSLPLPLSLSLQLSVTIEGAMGASVLLARRPMGDLCTVLGGPVSFISRLMEGAF